MSEARRNGFENGEYPVVQPARALTSVYLADLFVLAEEMGKNLEIKGGESLVSHVHAVETDFQLCLLSRIRTYLYYFSFEHFSCTWLILSVERGRQENSLALNFVLPKV